MTGARSRRALLQDCLLICSLAAVAAPARAAPGDDAGADLAAQAHALLAGLQARPLQAFLDLWPTGADRIPAGAAQSPVVATTIPVLRYLAAAHERAPAFSAPFVATLVAVAPALAWRRTYTESQVGAPFLDNYGWTELVGLTGPLRNERLACGVLMLGPQVTYPPHHHEADEVYVPLSGVARWQHAGGPWRARAPGSVIHHRSGESHAMQTGMEPMLALYLWRSRNLAQKSLLDAERWRS